MIHVWKMHGCGNDFCIIPFDPYIMDYSKLAIKLCDRRLGIGADGLIIVKDNPLEAIFYNNDGTRFPMSGNGSRCFAKYCYDLGLAKKNMLSVTTGVGKVEIEVLRNNPFTCKVNLGKPIFNNSMLGVDDELNCFGRTIKIRDTYITIYSLFMDSIHTVIFVDDFDSNVLNYAKEISSNHLFVKNTNVDFVKVVSKDEIKVKTYDKNQGYVLSSGTGVAASVVAAQKLGYTKTIAKAQVEMGTLKVEITKKGFVYIEGPAEKVFECDYSVEV